MDHGMSSERNTSQLTTSMTKRISLSRRRRPEMASFVIVLVAFLGLLPWETVSFLTTSTTNRGIGIQNQWRPTPLSFVHRSALFAKKEVDDPDDVPKDWSEEDILAGFDDVDIVDADEDLDVADDAVVETTNTDDDAAKVVKEDEDDDEIDEMEEEDEDEDEDLVEEVVGDVGDFEGDWDDEEEEEVEKQGKDIEWDEDEDGGDYELVDDPDDPDYMRQKALVEEAIDAAEQRALDESFDPLEFVMNEITPEQREEMDQLPFMKAVEEQARDMILTEKDVEGIDLEEAVAAVSDVEDDPYPRHDDGEVNILNESIGLSDDDMERLDETYKKVQDIVATEPWDKVMLKDMTGWEGLSNKTLEEMDACLEEIGGSAYNVTKWLLYDLDFNVSNLILSAVKHKRDAPILFQHWYPQLVTYDRYKHAQDRDFDFTWEDVEKADISELERYYKGFGYDEIPSKPPAETGIISLEDLDEEEIKMAAFENWMAEVYNPEWDKKDFDDDDMQDEDNVFSEFYEPPQHPDFPPIDDAAEDVEEWKEEIGDEPAVRAYRDKMGQSFQYDVEEDDEFQREYRGHVIIACTGEDEDLEVAEKITLRFAKELGKKVFVETRVLALAREEDNVFEIWLESYDIDLLHSKKRASSNAKGWTGPAEVDEAQIDVVVDRVRFLISDNARYSYRWEFDFED
jgi:hypothetical protein